MAIDETWRPDGWGKEPLNEAHKRKAESVIGLPTGESTVTYRSATGEPYITMTNGGIKLEGAGYPSFATSRAAALRGYFAACRAYVMGRGGVLYWRHAPHIIKFGDDQWVVYSRLLVSDQPVLKAA